MIDLEEQESRKDQAGHLLLKDGLTYISNLKFNT